MRRLRLVRTGESPLPFLAVLGAVATALFIKTSMALFGQFAKKTKGVHGLSIHAHPWRGYLLEGVITRSIDGSWKDLLPRSPWPPRPGCRSVQTVPRRIPWPACPP